MHLGNTPAAVPPKKNSSSSAHSSSGVTNSSLSSTHPLLAKRQQQLHSPKEALLLSPTVIRLLCVGLIFSFVFAYLFFLHTHHDPMWSRHMMDDRRSASATSSPSLLHPSLKNNNKVVVVPDPEPVHKQVQGEPSLVNYNRDEELRTKYNVPVNGSAFLADYDVSAIRPLDDPPLSKEHPTYKFKYARNSSKYTIHYLSAQPMVGWIPNFLTDAECDGIVAEALKTMKRSQVVPYKDSKDQTTVSQVRTSSQTWLSTDHPAAKPVIDRILDLTGFPQGSTEMLQVLRYEPGQKYDAHLDYFDPKLYGKQTSNRALTAYLYLSTVEEGGYTQFPRANGKPPTWDFTSCQAGLKVRPVKGTLAIFYDMKPNGEFDDYSLHGACKPVIGTKFGGTLWLRVPTLD